MVGTLYLIFSKDLWDSATGYFITSIFNLYYITSINFSQMDLWSWAIKINLLVKDLLHYGLCWIGRDNNKVMHQVLVLLRDGFGLRIPSALIAFQNSFQRPDYTAVITQSAPYIVTFWGKLSHWLDYLWALIMRFKKENLFSREEKRVKDTGDIRGAA